MRHTYTGKHGKSRAADQHPRLHRYKGRRKTSWRTTLRSRYGRFKLATKGRWGLILGWSVLVGGGIVLFLRLVSYY